MKCLLFSCNSNYYYDDISNSLPSEDEEFEEIINKTSRQKDLHYKLEKTINKIIYDAKKTCAVNSDFEQVEKIPNQQCEYIYSDDSLDDIDIILKKNKTKNMFLKSKEKDNQGDILLLPSQNVKQRIYSLGEDNQDTKNIRSINSIKNNNQQIDLQNDEIIENFKHVLCNGLNQYIQEMLEKIKKNTTMQMTIESTELVDMNNSCYKTSEKKSDILDDVISNWCDIPYEHITTDTNDENINYLKGKELLKDASCKFENQINENTSGKNIYHVKSLIDANAQRDDTRSRNTNPETFIENVKQNKEFTKKMYKHKRNNLSKRKYKHNTYSAKRKKWTKENPRTLSEKKKVHWSDTLETCEKRSNVPRKYILNYLNKSSVGVSNISAKYTGLKGQQRYNESEISYITDSSEDFTFKHFQKNENNDILNKFDF
ncbi:hypothetical protein, conserved [Plasmodium gonderi]|uniref:Uncharacterized protein n=1 Tax=Plasmodium gonderi TaxID=77519 RepID=A0A1Y1JJH2_PLAGO|nr:hypothetical protein, conserved [Plasmodium gonderi]GAW81565.1 hypothetical protein, conserved [Plasmodium gonderi]